MIPTQKNIVSSEITDLEIAETIDHIGAIYWEQIDLIHDLKTIITSLKKEIQEWELGKHTITRTYHFAEIKRIHDGYSRH